MNVDVLWDTVPSYLLHAVLARLIFTLKMEVICSSETSVYILTTRRYISEDDNIV
jgi:hypothetical protein